MCVKSLPNQAWLFLGNVVSHMAGESSRSMRDDACCDFMAKRIQALYHTSSSSEPSEFALAQSLSLLICQTISISNISTNISTCICGLHLHCLPNDFGKRNRTPLQDVGRVFSRYFAMDCSPNRVLTLAKCLEKTRPTSLFRFPKSSFGAAVGNSPPFLTNLPFHDFSNYFNHD